LSFDLLAWYRPIPATAAACEQLLSRHYEGGETVFEASAALQRFRDALLERYPPLENVSAGTESAWAMTPVPSNRLLELNLSWKAEDAALLAVVALARKHRVVLYDPQGPDVHSPEGIPRAAGGAAEKAPTRRNWFPILVVGSVFLLSFGLWFLMALAANTPK
jgi:hypothetical protein